MNILLSKNLLFIRMDIRHTFIKESEAKYMAGAVSGGIFPDEIYSLSEIKAAFPDVVECDFLTLREAYNKP